ncbi:MAG: metallophosphoesterase [Syntrophomonas sp.]
MGFWSKTTLIVMISALYIAWRGRQVFVKACYKKIYWFCCLAWLAAILFILSVKWGADIPGRVLTWVGSYSMAAFFYAFLIVLLLDIIHKTNSKLDFIPPAIKATPSQIVVGVILILLGILGYGTWNAWHPVVRSYEINISKEVAGSKDLHAVLVSDLHLGDIVDRQRLSSIVDLTNRQNPDLVILAGDVVDEGNLKPFKEQRMDEILMQLKPKLGTFMIMGNHDVKTGEEEALLRAAGITILRDQYLLVDNRFYLIGRENRDLQPPWTKKWLSTVMEGINHELPIILIDHNPYDFFEPVMEGVDLQLSGHTHQGQIFPNNLITACTYEVDWGYLQKNSLQVVVSSGIGTTGPPLRVGTTPELVDLMIHFK